MAGEVLKQTMPPTWHLAKMSTNAHTQKRGEWGKQRTLPIAGFALKLLSAVLYNDLYFPFEFKLVFNSRLKRKKKHGNSSFKDLSSAIAHAEQTPKREHKVFFFF